MLLSDFVCRYDLHGRPQRKSTREYRDYAECFSGAPCRTGLPRLLRASLERELFLLRRDVLGVPGRYLVLERLVRRTLVGHEQ